VLQLMSLRFTYALGVLAIGQMCRIAFLSSKDGNDWLPHGISAAQGYAGRLAATITMGGQYSLKDGPSSRKKAALSVYHVKIPKPDGRCVVLCDSTIFRTVYEVEAAEKNKKLSHGSMKTCT
jgi:hypothetical protein